jgi:L-ascorbate metabolism protein UlaG (beta-lactamase superfamily)
MGRRWGRPDISRYADRFDVPASDGGLAVTFLGVASLLVSDGTSAVLTDGFFSRPSLPRVLLGRIAPDHTCIQAALGRAGVGAVDAVVPVHTHYDHALDSATVAAATGARLLVGTSAAQIGVGGGLPQDRITLVTPGRPVACGRFTLTLVESAHCPPDRYPGVIEHPVVPPARMSAYHCGGPCSILLAHASGRTALTQGSAGFVRGALTGRAAEVAYLGVGQLGHQDPATSANTGERRSGPWAPAG